jgi:hypothetical protein
VRNTMAKLKLKHREIGSHSIRLDKEQVAFNKKVAKLEKDIQVAAKRSPYKWSALILRSGQTGKLYAYPSWRRAVNLDDIGQNIDLHHAIGGIEGYTITREGHNGWKSYSEYATRPCAPDIPVALIYPYENDRWAVWGDYPMPDEALTEEAVPIVLALVAEVERMDEAEERRLANEARWSRPWEVGEQLCDQSTEKGPIWTVLAVRGEYVTIRKGKEKPVRRKVRTGWLTPRIRVGTTILVRRGWAV